MKSERPSIHEKIKNSGPLHVVSTNGQKIVVSQRIIYNASFSESMGMPGNALSTDYYFPWYDGQGMQTWLAVANTGAPAIQTVGGLGAGAQSVSAGGGHTCALTAGSTVRCWGANGSGQVGDNSSQMRTSPASAQLADVVTYARTYWRHGSRACGDERGWEQLHVRR